jgi:hypothetical protein
MEQNKNPTKQPLVLFQRGDITVKDFTADDDTYTHIGYDLSRGEFEVGSITIEKVNVGKGGIFDVGHCNNPEILEQRVQLRKAHISTVQPSSDSSFGTLLAMFSFRRPINQEDA